MSNNYLEHYGVPGMRWGVRRSTPTLRLTGPSSGSSSSKSRGPTGGKSSSGKKKKGPKIVDVDYTEVGGSSNKKSKTKQQSYSGSNDNNSNKSNQQQNTQRSESKSFDVNGARNGLKTGKQLAEISAQNMAKDRRRNALTRIKSEARDMSDADLKKVIDRLSLEDRYVSIHEKRGVTDAKSNLEKTLEVAGQVAAHADTALSIYNTIQEIRNGRR